MSGLLTVDFQSPDAGRLFTQSLKETGFAVLINHPVSEQQVQGLYRLWQDFFSSADKHRLLYNADSYDGFFPIEEAESAKGQVVRDLKEYFHFYLWGQCPETLRAETTDYYNKTVAFASQLLAWVEEYSPAAVRDKLSEPFSCMIRDSQLSLLRILHYPPLPEDREASAIRAHAHEDINLLTILPAANEPGLQVKSLQGEWLDVPCDFGNLIINCGDMLQEASDHHYPSTTHRVINPEQAEHHKSRISIPLFLHPRPEVVLSERYSAEQYRQERLAELRQTS